MTDYDAIFARREAILGHLVDEGSATTRVLAGMAGTSASTARRDLETLSDLGYAGGVDLGRGTRWSPSERSERFIRSRRSRAAASGEENHT